MLRAIERATGIEYKVKKIEGGFEIYTIDGEKYKNLKESTFKRYFKPVKAAEAEQPVEEPTPEEPEYDEPEQETVEPEAEEQETTQEEEPKTEKKSKKSDKKQKKEEKKQVTVELTGVDRDNMIEKIKKMFNLSENNPSVEEATSAVLMAQKLMAKYNINEEDLSLEEVKDDEIGYMATTLRHDSSLHTWRKNLGMVVAKNFRVKCYMLGKDVTFRGFKADVEIAVEVFTYLYALGNKLGSKKYHDQLKETGSAKDVYNSFVGGFLEGIEEALNEQCTALMLVIPKAVEEEYEIFGKENFKGKQKGLMSVVAGKIYEEGKIEGKAAVKSRQLKDKKNKGGK